MTDTIAAVQAKPYVIQIDAHATVAFAQAAVHIRNGYVFNPDVAPVIYPTNGVASFTLVLGTPEQHAISAAEAATDLATELMEAARQREIEAAARQMVEAAKRDAAKAELDAQIDVQTRALRKLKDQAAKI